MNNYVLKLQRVFQSTMLPKAIKIIGIFLSFLILILWFIPFLDIDYQMVRKHDFLDSAFVMNHVYGKYIAGDINAFSVFLNGNYSVLNFSRAFQPLSLLYLFDNSYAVYFFLDFIVRIIGFLGMYLLVLKISTDKLISFYLAVFFSLSISYSVFLLSGAGIPFLFWSILVVDTIKKNIFKYLLFLLVFFIGLNSSLILSGVFVLILSPFIINLVFGLSIINRQILLILMIYLLGLILNSFGLIYDFLFSSSISHRTEWVRCSQDSLFVSLKDSLQRFLKHPFYHAHVYNGYISIVIVLIFTLYCFLKKNSKSIYMLFLLILFILFIWVIKGTPVNCFIYEYLNFLEMFHWDRFYFLLSFLFSLFTALIYLKSPTFLKVVIIITLLIESIFFLYHGPHIKKIYNEIINYYHLPLKPETLKNIYNINNYYMENDFIEIKKIVKNHTVISYQPFALDPMISPFNNITSADGYIQSYPLFYKHQFYEIIKDSIEGTGRNRYFKNWGSRVYLFNPRADIDLINFCEASALNVRYILSRKKLNNKHLIFVYMTNENEINIYSINYSYCN